MAISHDVRFLVCLLIDYAIIVIKSAEDTSCKKEFWAGSRSRVYATVLRSNGSGVLLVYADELVWHVVVAWTYKLL
jgi:hypothetical protein